MPNAQTLFMLTNRVADNLSDSQLRDQWVEEIRNAGTNDLVDLTGHLTSDKDHRPANVKALREAIISEIERKNTERIVTTMEKLDDAANRLTWASFVVAAVGLILAAIQVWQGFRH